MNELLLSERDWLQQSVLKLYQDPQNAPRLEEIAIRLFRYQARQNPVYQQFLRNLHISIEKIQYIDQIPCLPIECFKYHPLQTEQWTAEMVFTSSGTSLAQPSRHLVRQPEWYLKIAELGFESAYGKLSDWVILALLPSYLERQGSSLVYMLDHFIKKAKAPSGFFLYNTQELLQTLEKCRKNGQKVLIWGVTYALLDLAENHKADWSEGVVIMETGGMKGKREELPKSAVHSRLCNAFNLSAIHSEYGMTELFSQGYSQGEGRFKGCPSLQIMIRDATDPFALQAFGKSGGINIIDLANIDSIAFIATDDLGKLHPNNEFEVLGRLDNSDVRGCNLML